MSQRNKSKEESPEQLAAEKTKPEQYLGPMPQNHRELAEAIFASKSPVNVGRELLNDTSDKGASVRMRVFETFVDWLYGSPRAASADQGVRIIWDIPGPEPDPQPNPN